jgi:hypothetical protein
MNNIITITDFVGQYTISDLGYSEDNFESTIAQLQDDLLKMCLTVDLYEDLKVNPTAQKWVDFLYGKIYTDTTACKRYYKGFKSFLLKYVYAYHIENNQYTITSVGAVENNRENMTNLTDFKLRRLVYNTYNKSVDEQSEMYVFLYKNEATYPDAAEEFQFLKKRYFVEKHSIS